MSDVKKDITKLSIEITKVATQAFVFFDMYKRAQTFMVPFTDGLETVIIKRPKIMDEFTVDREFMSSTAIGLIQNDLYFAFMKRA